MNLIMATSAYFKLHVKSFNVSHNDHLVLLIGETLFKNAKVSVVSNRIGMNFGRIVSQLNTQRLAESDL